MQVLGTYHKRKSIEKVDPQMPKRKISDNSRTQSKRKHRTEYKTIDSPQVQLKAYKRKNLSILNELEGKHIIDKLSTKPQTITHTEQSKILTEQSQSITKEVTSIRKIQNNSVNSAKHSKSSKPQQSTATNIDSRQVTSRFTISHEDQEDFSLSSLINQNKTTDSNPLINTARLRDEQGVYVNSFQFRDGKIQRQSGVGEKGIEIKQDELDQVNQVKGGIQNQLENNTNPNDVVNNDPQRIQQNAVEDEDERQNQEGQNFDDYQFGGKNSLSQEFDQEQSVQKSTSRKKQKKRKASIMPPPPVQSYTFDALIRPKPQNWRQLNRYVPETQQQQRMAQQRLSKEKQSLQFKRQQQQIMKMVQEYQQNKNTINLVSQRKTETSKIMQKIYRDKRLTKQSVSLPKLKPLSLPKRQILLSQTNTVLNNEGYAMENPVSIEERFKVNNTIAKNFKQQKKPKLYENIKKSLSYSKLGFGSSEPRLLNEQQLKESELESIEKIQKKLRQKGISFDATAVRKGLLNVRDVPIYKISSKPNNNDQSLNDEGKIDLPKKQLMSNGFYKIFPL